MAARFGWPAGLLALAILALDPPSAHSQDAPPAPTPGATASATATPIAPTVTTVEVPDAPLAPPDGATTEAVAAPPAEALEPTLTPDTAPAGAEPPLVAGATAGPSRVLYTDDFANPNSGWPRQASDARTRRIGYGDGEYYVARLAGTGGSPYVMRAERYDDFLVELDARLLEPTADAYLFLDFRWQPSGERYTFALAPDDGAFTLRRHTEQEGTTVIGWTPDEAIHAGTAWNRLGVRAQGPDIVLLVNGKEVGRTRDDALREGSLGFGVGHFADRAAEARFTNMVVTGLD